MKKADLLADIQKTIDKYKKFIDFGENLENLFAVSDCAFCTRQVDRWRNAGWDFSNAIRCRCLNCPMGPNELGCLNMLTYEPLHSQSIIRDNLKEYGDMYRENRAQLAWAMRQTAKERLEFWESVYKSTKRWPGAKGGNEIHLSEYRKFLIKRDKKIFNSNLR